VRADKPLDEMSISELIDRCAAIVAARELRRDGTGVELGRPESES
jgi:hypothetical protein